MLTVNPSLPRHPGSSVVPSESDSGLSAPSQFSLSPTYAVAMNRRCVASALVAASLGLGGCASIPLADTVTSLQVCAESVRILTDMEEVLRLAVANPLATETYAERLAELSGEFNALEPTDAELQAAHSALGTEIEGALEILQNPSISAVAELPGVVAQSQIALMDFTAACAP